MSNKKIQGSIVALVTPMLTDGSIDLAAFDRLLEWHIEVGTAGIVVAGTTGESATLSIEENCDLIAHAVEVAHRRIPIIAGTGSNCTSEAMVMTKAAKEQGADACLLVTPYYNKPPQEGLYQHFKTLAESVEIPQILYNVPSRTGCDLSLETIQRLALLDNIVAVKDATGDIPRGIELVERCGDKLAIYSGDDAITRPLVLAGADGTLSVTANVAPALMAELCALALKGDASAADAVDNKLAALHETLFLQANPIPVKWALVKMGLIGEAIRLPLVELDGRYQLQVSAAMQQAGIQLPTAAY